MCQTSCDADTMQGFLHQQLFSSYENWNKEKFIVHFYSFCDNGWIDG